MGDDPRSFLFSMDNLLILHLATGAHQIIHSASFECSVMSSELKTLARLALLFLIFKKKRFCSVMSSLVLQL